MINDISVKITPSSKAKTQIIEVLKMEDGVRYSVKNPVGFCVGDIIVFSDATTKSYSRVAEIQDNILTFSSEIAEDVVDKNLIPDKTISTCEFDVEVRYGDDVETYTYVSFNTCSQNFIEVKLAPSDFISVTYTGSEPEAALAPFNRLAAGSEPEVSVRFADGSNGDVLGMTANDFIGVDGGVGGRTGIQAFADNNVIAIIAAPGITDPKVQLSMITHCENMANRFAVLDMPQTARSVQEITEHRNYFDSSFAALYHPWIQVFDPLEKRNMMLPPSGSIVGIYARVDNTRGVHKAPANEAICGCTGLDIPFGKDEQDILNPRGVNLIRALPGQGIRVWGARTVSSDRNWRYVNVKRLFMYIEDSIRANTEWVVFEPNDEMLWMRVQRTISIFLNGLWRNGSLVGSSVEEAFFVNVGRNTMTQEDILNGRLICSIGVALVRPAEFVMFRITQNAGNSM